MGYVVNPFTGLLDNTGTTPTVPDQGEWGAATAKTVSAGAVTLDGPGRYLLDTESAAASDTLKTISGLSDGDEVILSLVSAARKVKLMPSVGNLKMHTTFTLTSVAQQIAMVADASLNVTEKGLPARWG